MADEQKLVATADLDRVVRWSFWWFLICCVGMVITLLLGPSSLKHLLWSGVIAMVAVVIQYFCRNMRPDTFLPRNWPVTAFSIMSLLILNSRLDYLMLIQNALLFLSVFSGIIFLWFRRLAHKQHIVL